MSWLLVTRCPQRLSCRACEPLSPASHIAQFHRQVIGNCGVIYLMQCNNRGKVKTLPGFTGRGRKIRRPVQYSVHVILRADCTDAVADTLSNRKFAKHAVRVRRTSESGRWIAAAIAGWRCAQYDGIVAWAASKGSALRSVAVGLSG